MKSGFEPVIFGFPDLPKQEADALLIQQPRLVLNTLALRYLENGLFSFI